MGDVEMVGGFFQVSLEAKKLQFTGSSFLSGYPEKFSTPKIESPQIVISQALGTFKQGTYLEGFVGAIPSLRWEEGSSQRISKVFSKSMSMWPFVLFF